MNKKELAAVLAEKTGLSQRNAGEAVNAAIETICGALEAGESVQLIGFGTFSVAQRAAKSGVNPATGAKITIPACKAVKFKPGQALKDAVN